jgi:hypothetical protein
MGLGPEHSLPSKAVISSLIILYPEGVANGICRGMDFIGIGTLGMEPFRRSREA